MKICKHEIVLYLIKKVINRCSKNHAIVEAILDINLRPTNRGNDLQRKGFFVGTLEDFTENATLVYQFCTMLSYINTLG